MSEKAYIIDNIFDILFKNKDGDITMGSSGSGSCFYSNKPIIISKEYHYKNQAAVLRSITKLCDATSFSVTHCLIDAWQEALKDNAL